MYIAPNSTIRLCNDVPFDSSYEHTLYFANSAQQLTYFTSKTKYTLERNYYVRKGRGALKVKLPIGSCIDCNYMIFKNTSYENKWFYAFVTDAEYVNNETTLIRFEIDYVQTYLFDIDYTKQQFIERMTAPTDEIGDNLVPEGLETGEYITRHREITNKLANMVYVIATTNPKLPIVDQATPDTAGGLVYNGIYSGLVYEIYDDVEDLGLRIYRYNNLLSAKRIVGVFMMPAEFAENYLDVIGNIPEDITDMSNRIVSENMSIHDYQLPSALINNYLGRYDYEPRNKKLLTAPYSMIHVSNTEGDYADYGREYFQNKNSITFGIGCTMGMPPVACAIPKNYKGPYDYNFNEMLIMSHFPQCSYNSDTFKAYLAQIALPALASGITPLLGFGVGGLSAPAFDPNPAANASFVPPTPPTFSPEGSAAYSRMLNPPNVPLLGTTHNTVSQWETEPAQSVIPEQFSNSTFIPSSKLIGGVLAAGVGRLTHPRQAQGQTTYDIMSALGRKDFCFEHKCITEEFARIIDDYFDRFGYAYHRLGTLSFRNRPEWTFIQTRACDIHGNFPQNVAKHLDAILNKGITFWVDARHVADYSYNNSPV